MDVCVCYMCADTDMDMSIKYWHTCMILCTCNTHAHVGMSRYLC